MMGIMTMIYIYYGHFIIKAMRIFPSFSAKNSVNPSGNVEMSLMPPPVTVIMTMTAENDQGYIVEKDEEDRFLGSP